MDISSFNNKIIIVNDSMKPSLLELMSNKLLNIKIITLSELKRNYYFDYDKETIYYVSNKYDVCYEVAETYINNLYYFGDVIDDKTKFLESLKNDLDENGLLYYNELFKSYIENSDVILLDLEYTDKFYRNIFDNINNKEYVSIYNNSSVKELYKCNNILEELSLVCSKICSLIKDGVDINRIKLCNVSEDNYYNVVRFFNMFNIPLNIKSISSINGTALVKIFKDNYDSDLSISLNKVYENINNTDDEVIYKQLVNIVNEYAFIDDKLVVKDFIYEDISNVLKKNTVLENAVRVVDFTKELFSEDDYVFLINYNEGAIPISRRDDDYLSDKTKSLIGISTSYELNNNEIEIIKNRIRGINNLTVSYSLYNLNSVLYLSPSYDKDLFIEKEYSCDYTNSNLYNTLELVKSMDEYNKFNSISSNLGILSNHYKDLKYSSYSNKYTGIDKKELYDFLGKKLSLSYTKVNSYYECSFKYYLDYILKLNKYEDSFDSVIGSIFHKVLSLCFNDEFDFEKCFKETVDSFDYGYSNMELFFLNKLKNELKLTIDAINTQLEYMSFHNFMYEQNVVIKVSDDVNVTFTGYLDKVMFEEYNGCNLVVIVDYKTGNTSVDINNTPYGLSMQLPIYMYLIKNSGLLKNVRIGGLYLQKIISKMDQEKDDSMKLEGYTNSSEEVMSLIDKSYENSKIIKGLKYTNSGLSSNAKVLSDDEMEYLEKIVNSKINESYRNILDARFDINPKVIKGENLGCRYCKYKDICFVKNEDIVELEYKKLEFGGEVDA